jgi:predicted porin
VLDDTEVADIFNGPRRSNLAFPLTEGTELFGSYGDGFNNNTVRYDSPTINGASATVMYGAGEAADHMGDNYGARLAYSHAATGLFANYAFMSKKQVGNNIGQTHRVEFGYDANNLFVSGTYQWLKVHGDATALGVADSAAELKNQSWAFAAAYTLGAFKPMFLYSKRNNPEVDGSRKDWGATQWTLGLQYTLSKATLLEGAYAQLTNNPGAQAALKQSERKSSEVYLMMKHNF